MRASSRSALLTIDCNPLPRIDVLGQRDNGFEASLDQRRPDKGIAEVEGLAAGSKGASVGVEVVSSSSACYLLASELARGERGRLLWSGRPAH